jgi:hypothetical protein
MAWLLAESWGAAEHTWQNRGQECVCLSVCFRALSFLFFSVLWIEPTVSHMVGEHFATKSCPQAQSTVIGLSFYPLNARTIWLRGFQACWNHSKAFAHSGTKTGRSTEVELSRTERKTLKWIPESDGILCRETCYDLALKCPPNLPCLVPNTVEFRGGAYERWLDHEGSYLMNGLIHLWIHSLLGLGRSELSLCFLSAMKWAALRHHILLPQCSASPQAQSDRAKRLWTETSEIMSWLKMIDCLRCFVIEMENWLTHYLLGTSYHVRCMLYPIYIVLNL